MLLLERMSHQADHGHSTVDLWSSAMRERPTDDVSALESTEAAHADTIAARTRTKLSLVDVPMDTLEASLVDTAPLALGGHAPVDSSEGDREYQRFLTTLLPNEQMDLSFLDEEDEEYRPEGDEDDDQEDDDARQGISKKELTDLLLDSTRMTSLTASPAVTLEPKGDNEVVGAKLAVDGPNEWSYRSGTRGEGGRKGVMAAAEPAPKTGNTPVAIPAVRQGRPVTVSRTQCIQLASQMHKHLQLLLQSYHLLASQPARSELAECRAMIEELQARGEKALAYKNALLSKLNPGTRSSAGVASTRAADADVGGHNDISCPGELSGVDENGGSADFTGNMLASRRVTRSLTAAHAAVAHPSMFELVGSQTVDELSAGFARGCSLEERDRAVQEQMLQLDTHLLSAKKRRKSKKGYSMIEDALLAHGAKRFGTQATSWDQIRRHFLPSKTTQNLRHRYKYLISPKTGMNAIKALHARTGPPHHNNSWLLEEDLRIARGLVELHGEKYPFSRLSKSYLPHRSRLEIRKRWERLVTKFRLDLADMKLAVPADDSLDLVVAMKELLEDKLRARMLYQHGKAEKAKPEAAVQLDRLGQGRRNALVSASVGKEATPGASSLATGTQTTGSSSISCRSKNLHPALFFSSWSFISPATLLNGTCEHNWPSFMDEDNESVLRKQLSASDVDNQALQPESQHVCVSGQPVALSTVQTREFMWTAMPSDGAVTPPTDSRLPQATTSDELDAYKLQKDSEEEDDDDSDYEHDELLSSDSEESGSDFEQMEFTDADDDTDANGDREANTDALDQCGDVASDVDDRSVADADSPNEGPCWSPLSSSMSDPPGLQLAYGGSDASRTRIRHPLRLQNLSRPGNERIGRALAALEQRIVGKSINQTVALSATSSQTGCADRTKRKVVSTFVAPLSSDRTRHGHFPASIEEPTPAGGTALTASGADNDNASRAEDESGDESVEVADLFSSSTQLFVDDDSKAAVEIPRSGQAHECGWDRNVAGTASRAKVCAPFCSSTPPSKKVRLEACPSCSQTVCICRSSDLR